MYTWKSEIRHFARYCLSHCKSESVRTAKCDFLMVDFQLRLWKVALHIAYRLSRFSDVKTVPQKWRILTCTWVRLISFNRSHCPLFQELINAEVAQQTSNTPLAFQHENTAPREYFQRLIESFEERMYLYRRQVEEVESHLASLQQPQSVSPQGMVLQRTFKLFRAPKLDAQ